MSAEQNQQEQDTNQSDKQAAQSGRRKRNVIIFCIVLAVVALGALLYWLRPYCRSKDQS